MTNRLLPLLATWIFAATLVPADAKADDSLPQYHRQRLRLVDKDLQVLGPASAGFDSKPLTVDAGERYYVVIGAEPSDHLMVPELIEILGDDGLATAHRYALGRARGLTGLGIGLLVTASVLLPTAAAVVASDPDVGFEEPGYWFPRVVVPIVAVMFPLGGLSAAFGQTRIQRLHSDEVRVVADRREMWDLVDAHNSILRIDLDLPDDSRLDGPR